MPAGWWVSLLPTPLKVEMLVVDSIDNVPLLCLFTGGSILFRLGRG